MNETTKVSILLFASGFFATMLVLTTIQIVSAQVNVDGMVPEIHEDQIITCVKDVSDTETRGSLICHIFDVDDLDWYQEISELNYGQIGDNNDSFSMGLVD